MSEDQAVDRAVSFGAVADVYERARPTYPQAALDWLLPAGARRVLDLGVGTGKLTRLLADRDLDVVAVEPSEGMRAAFAAGLPGIDVLAGAGERIPLGDASMDAVLVAQAWHWVDPGRAAPEVARVLRPGGRLGLLWNLRDERIAWVRAFDEILGGGTGESPADSRSQDPVVGPPFAELERHAVAWADEVDPAALVELAASRSYVITLDDERRSALLDRVRRLISEHPDVKGRSRVTLPYLTECFRADLPS